MKHISMDLVRVTEAAAISASAWVGSGNKLLADKAATDAMRDRLSRMNNFLGHIRIGEGKKDQSYGLFKGDTICGPLSTCQDCCISPCTQQEEYDIAVDPIDGTTPTVNSGPEATSVIALAEKGAMFDTEEHYMLKLAVSGFVARRTNLYLSTPLPVLCKQVADVLNKPVDKLMVCILNRPRHQEYINQMREIGVRIKLIQDCDISGAIAAVEGNIDMQFGVGGAPEAVLTAAAVKCLGGFFLSQVWNDGKLLGDPMTHDDLVRGYCCFAATGITDGTFLKGVRWGARGPITHSVFMRSESGTVRYVETRHGN
jgi:fructose-1,6-bisphosphatase/sedoheptulose 1,7-bisphosphatase-like protein